MKVVKLKSFAFESKGEFLSRKAEGISFGALTYYELCEKLGLGLREHPERIQAFVKVGKRWKILRGKLRSEIYHCQCGSCDPEVRYHIVRSGQQTEGEVPAT